ncbi:MAG: T9SS type A sorting domain-containing protein [Bacteroidia bacterium]|nr:T9SS type A sorting domain-containing protein [Bacteroidia bacterium]
MKNKTTLIMLLFGIFFQRVLSQTDNIELVSKILSNTPCDVALYENHLYVVNVGLAIFDFSNPGNAIFEKHLTPLEDWSPREFIIDGNKGYASWNGGGIMLIDFSDPDNPTHNSNTLNSSFDYQNLILNYPYLFAIGTSQTNDSLYLQAMDITDGTILSSVNLISGFTHNAYEAKRFIVDSNYLYLTMGPRGQIDTTELHIFDISTLTDISHISSVYLGLSNAMPVILQGSLYSIAKRNNYLYISGRFVDTLQGKSHIKIIDISSASSPFLAKQWTDTVITGFSGDIEISNDYIILTDVNAGFNVISISNDTSLTLCNRLNTFCPPYYVVNFEIRKYQNNIFLFNFDNYAVYTIDITNPCGSTLLDTIPFAHDWKDISAPDTNFIFATIWDFYQCYSLDVSNIQSPFISHRTEVKGWCWGIDVKGDYAYLAMGLQNHPLPDESGGLFVYDISNPNAPQKKGWIPPYSNNHDVQVFADTLTDIAYVIAGQPNSEGESFENHHSQNPGLRLIDISNPISLVELGSLFIKPQCRGLFKSGNYIYIAASDADSSAIIDTSGIYIVDVTNPANPFITGKWVRTGVTSKEHTRAVYVKNNYAYLAHAGSLVTLNVSNPASLSFVSEIALDNSQSMDISGIENYVFTLTRDGLYVFDITTPNEPLLIDSAVNLFFMPARHLDIEPPYIYVLTGAGVFIFRCDGLNNLYYPMKSALNNLILYPNPANDNVEIVGLQAGIIEIINLQGQVIKIFEVYNEKTSLDISKLSGGVYTMRFKTCDEIIMKKLVKE